MNPGSLPSRTPKFERLARQHMSDEELRNWKNYNNFTQGAVGKRAILAATRAIERTTVPEIAYGKKERQERRRLQKRSKNTTAKLAQSVKRALDEGNQAKLRRATINFFRSFDTRYLAYCIAYKSMSRVDRPHIGALAQFAADLDPFKLEIEPAKLIYKKHDWACAGQKKTGSLRTLLAFGIHHRARQQQVLLLLKVCLGDFERRDQFCVVARGRNGAVQRAIELMQRDTVEFVAECDISNFFPSVGEGTGCFAPALVLQELLPMLPRAVLESTVLASGVIAHRALPGGLEAPYREIYARTGIPQGSVLSSYLAEFIMSEILSCAETPPLGDDMIAYVDNIGLFAEDADDIRNRIQLLVASAKGSSFGSFDLRQSQTIRHKSQGFIFLGYYLEWNNDTEQVKVEVSDKNKLKLKNSLNSLLARCHPSSSASRELLAENRRNVRQSYRSWIASFSLVPDIDLVGRTLFAEVLRNQHKKTRRYFRNMLVQ
ncbi:MAG: hypothetical protein ABJH63_10265 [Rhizobiaceae bacterium]